MNRIKELRKEKKLTLKQLSEELAKQGYKITPDALSKYERGEREPKLNSWSKLANFFGVSIGYLQGQGWSKEYAIKNLAIVYASHNYYYDSEFFEDENCKNGKVYKYQINMVEELNDHSYIILKTAYSLGITDDSNDNWQIFGNEKFPDVDSFSKEDREKINQKLIDNSECIDVHEFLNFIFSRDEIHELESNTLDFIENVVFGRLSFEESKYFSLFKKAANKYLKVLNDYVFLSTIEENKYKTGIAGSYELAVKVKLYVQNVLARNVFSNSEELSRKALAAYLKPIKSNEVKESLTDLFEELLGELDELREQVDSIQYRLDNPKDYDNNSFDD